MSYTKTIGAKSFTRYGATIEIGEAEAKFLEFVEKFPEHIKDAVEYVGLSLRKDMIAKAKAYQTGAFKYQGVYFRKSKEGGRVKLQKEEGTARKPYERYKDGQKMSDLSELIRSVPYFHLKKVIVGWLDVRGFRDSQGRRVQGAKVSQIGEQMESGRSITITRRMRGMLHYSGIHTKASTLTTRAYPVVSRTAMVAAAIAEQKLDKKMKELLQGGSQ
jgi:hypothetical protein